MKIEKLNNKKSVGKGILIGFVICLLFVIIVSLLTSKAKYQNSETVKIVEGKVNYVVPDLNVMAVYLKNGKEYVTSKEIPETGYILNKNTSYCTVPDNEEKIRNTLEYIDGKLTVDLRKKGTKCYLYFDIKTISGEELIADLKSKTKGKIEVLTGPSCNESLEKCNTDNTVENMKQNGIYESDDDNGTSYVYRGSIDNNWIKFGKDINNQDLWWRIIRINGNNTFRLIYSGTGKAVIKGEDSQIATIPFNDDFDDNTYVGYYNIGDKSTSYEEAHKGTNPSTLAKTINDWFENKTKLKEEIYINQIDTESGFCNDRTISTGEKWWLNEEEDPSNRGWGAHTTIYYPINRYMFITGFASDNQTPTLKCKNQSRDLYTVTTANYGNKILTYPVGTITIDEILLAGAYGGQKNHEFWLYNGLSYWTMSPGYYRSDWGCALLECLVDGEVTNYGTNIIYGVRPVINLRADIQIKEGTDGTINNPYEVL